LPNLAACVEWSAPQHCIGRSSRRAPSRELTAVLAYVRPSCCSDLGQGPWVRVLWPCAPRRQGQALACEPPLPLVDCIHPCCHATVSSAARHAALSCELAFVPCAYLSCRCSRTPWQPRQAHPNAQGQGLTVETPSPLASGFARRCRGSVLNVARRAFRSSELAFVPSGFSSCSGSRTRWQPSQVHPIADPSCDVHHDAACVVAGRAEPRAARRAWAPRCVARSC
jgi:hypothetical protein